MTYTIRGAISTRWAKADVKAAARSEFGAGFLAVSVIASEPDTLRSGWSARAPTTAIVDESPDGLHLAAESTEGHFMTRTTRVALTVLLAVGMGAGLVGCASTTASPVATTAASSAHAAVAPVVGDTIAAEQVAALPVGQKGYELANGDTIVVDVNQPLPVPVAQEI
jgi:hypothetical protein